PRALDAGRRARARVHEKAARRGGLAEAAVQNAGPHEDGILKRRHEMQVRDAMATTISAADRNDTIARVVQLMKEEDAGFIPVVDGQRPVGVITDRDVVLRCLAEYGGAALDQPVEKVMS